MGRGQILGVFLILGTRELIIPGHEPLVMKNFANPIERIAEIG